MTRLHAHRSAALMYAQIYRTCLPELISARMSVAVHTEGGPARLFGSLTTSSGFYLMAVHGTIARMACINIQVGRIETRSHMPLFARQCLP